MKRKTPDVGETVYYKGNPFKVKASVMNVGFMLDNEKSTVILMCYESADWYVEDLIKENE
jgi:hypothetical protein